MRRGGHCRRLTRAPRRLPGKLGELRKAGWIFGQRKLRTMWHFRPPAEGDQIIMQRCKEVSIPEPSENGRIFTILKVHEPTKLDQEHWYYLGREKLIEWGIRRDQIRAWRLRGSADR